MKKVSQICFNIQGFIFSFIEKEIERPLTEKLKGLVAILELGAHIWVRSVAVTIKKVSRRIRNP